MLKKSLFIISIYMFVFSFSVHAGIGLTKEECHKEYGKPIKKDESNATYKYYTYNKDGFEIDVEIARGICNDVTFNKEKSSSGTITKEEVKTFISKNCKGKLTKIREKKTQHWTASYTLA